MGKGTLLFAALVAVSGCAAEASSEQSPPFESSIQPESSPGDRGTIVLPASAASQREGGSEWRLGGTDTHLRTVGVSPRGEPLFTMETDLSSASTVISAGTSHARIVFVRDGEQMVPKALGQLNDRA